MHNIITYLNPYLEEFSDMVIHRLYHYVLHQVFRAAVGGKITIYSDTYIRKFDIMQQNIVINKYQIIQSKTLCNKI